ncbi:hypothetical protein [Agromyces humi]|uniref:hypothetical protein n=1 Tax=Agromyces humi TaxID=1766800 RepID=UPI00135B2DEF|nr:hypothetical protein [Agromyces humi]
MPTTIEIPDFWVLFDENGVAKGSMYGLSSFSVYPTAESAWKDMAGDTKRERDKRERAGWYVAPVDQDEWAGYYLEGRKHVR